MHKILLFYITNSFPYIEAEVFCFDEAPFLQIDAFELHVFPRLSTPKKNAMYPYAISNILLSSFIKKILSLCSLKAAHLFFKEKKSCSLHGIQVSNMRILRAVGIAMHAYNAMKKYIVYNNFQNRKIIIYPFWFTEAAFGLSLLNNDFQHIQCITRVHGCDFNPHECDGYVPFRYLRCNTFDHIAAASNTGYEQLLQDGHCPSRLSVVHLGVPFSEKVTLPSETGELKIVSTAFLSKGKRIPLLLHSLIAFSREYPHITVHWCHFGGGEGFAELQDLCTKAKSFLNNFGFELTGDVPASEIRQRLASETFDVMISVSKFEGGVSVALQEAGCAGIPLIATDSQGVRAIINSETGFLLPVNFSTKEFNEALLNTYENKSLEKHEKIAAWCRKNFSMESNYKQFINSILLPLKF